MLGAGPYQGVRIEVGRYTFSVPPDLVGSEVNDFGFSPSVIARETDVLFKQATQFKLRSCSYVFSNSELERFLF